MHLGRQGSSGLVRVSEGHVVHGLQERFGNSARVENETVSSIQPHRNALFFKANWTDGSGPKTVMTQISSCGNVGAKGLSVVPVARTVS